MNAVDTIPKTNGLYKIREAARLVSWADGRPGDKALTKKLLREWVDSRVGLLRWADIPTGKKRITFRALISLRMIFRLHCQGMPCEAITEDAARLKGALGMEWPLASKDVWALKDDQLGKPVPSARNSENRYRRWQIGYQRSYYPLPTDFAHGLEFDEDGVACVWRPAKGVSIEPGIFSGSPCVAGTRIATWIVAGMAEAGDTIEEIADWYDLPQERIENAVEWERQLAAVKV